ncbi:MAG: hypothetical protein AAF215_00120 [Cyanobacteria bacterium P01_A01_bin.123]
MQSNINLSEFDAITFHFDGNNNDKDDISALPIAASIAQSAGLADKITFFYGNNLSEPDSTSQVAAMRESAAFADKLGITTHSYQDGIQQTTDELVKILNSGKKVLAIEGGPMEAIYRALEQTSPANRGNVVALSHSSWNENRAVGTRPGGGKPRTWSDIAADFPEVQQIDIQDQNNGSNNDKGFNSFEWDWLDTTNNPVLQEAREKMQNAQGKVNDPSDAGMLFYAITGQETADPFDAKAFFDANPPSFDPSIPPPPEPPTPNPSGSVFLAQNGQVVIEAESANPTGDWQKVTVGGEASLLWDAAQSSYGKVPNGQTLAYQFETDEAGTYSIAMHSGRIKSAMNASDRYENGKSGPERTDTGNDAYVSIINAETGAVVQSPTKLFTGLGSSDRELKWGTTFDANHNKSQAQVTLQADTQYRLEISGRSDGYALDRVTLSNDGFLKDADAPQSPIKGSNPNPPPEPEPEPEPNPTPGKDLITFALVNPETEEFVEGFEDLGANDTINLNEVDLTQYNVVAKINPDHPDAQSVKSVKFESPLGNRTENIKPYALFGDIDGDFYGKPLSEGDFTLKATAYTQEGAKGQVVGAADLDYSVVDGAQPQSDAIGEYGSLTLNDQWQTVALDETYDNPVVIVSDPTFNGSDPAAIRLRNITDNTFQVRLQEPKYKDDTHTNESVSYLVMEAGDWELADGTRLSAGTRNSDQLTTQGFESVDITGFESAPTVLSQVQTFNGGDWVTTRTKGQSATDFQVAMQEEEALNNGGHTQETIGWLAVESGTAFDGDTLMQSNTTGQSHDDSRSKVSFAADFDVAPAVIVKLGSFEGSDTANLRLDDISATSFGVRVYEEQSLDSELNHTTEAVSFLALEGQSGSLTGSAV